MSRFCQGGGSLSVSSTASGGGEEEGKEGEKRDLTRLMTPLKGSADSLRSAIRKAFYGWLAEIDVFLREFDGWLAEADEFLQEIR